MASTSFQRQQTNQLSELIDEHRIENLTQTVNNSSNKDKIRDTYFQEEIVIPEDEDVNIFKFIFLTYFLIFFLIHFLIYF